MVREIVSGGQTGADRGALDAAIELGLEHGGWCPRGRRAEDGTIPARYQLRETTEADYAARTERNVLDSDGTLLVTRGAPTGGSALTATLARRHARPFLHVDLAATPRAAADVRAWLASHRIARLNVAGPRERHAPGIADDVRALLRAALRPPPTWDELRPLLPPELRRWVLPDVTWDQHRLWAIDLPVRDVAVAELAWMLELPWWRDGDRYFIVRPVEVAADPARHAAQHARTLAADLTHPLVATTIEDRLVLLDGLHRLLKARMLGITTVRVRVLPADRIDEIRAT